jgi:hypothetical protein
MGDSWPSVEAPEYLFDWRGKGEMSLKAIKYYFIKLPKMKSTYRTNSLVARDQCLETGESF